MATQRQKNAKRQADRDSQVRHMKAGAIERRDTALELAKLPEKEKAQSEFTTVTGQTFRTYLSPITVATAMSQQPHNLLEIPLVDKRGKVSAAWFRAGALLHVTDLTGMRSFPR
jgi:hypothetical protein